MKCDVCNAPLCGRGPASTGVCYPCRQAGSRFVGNWAIDLRTQGHDGTAIGHIVGLAADSVRGRIRDQLRRLAATS